MSIDDHPVFVCVTPRSLLVFSSVRLYQSINQSIKSFILVPPAVTSCLYIFHNSSEPLIRPMRHCHINLFFPQQIVIYLYSYHTLFSSCGASPLVSFLNPRTCLGLGKILSRSDYHYWVTTLLILSTYTVIGGKEPFWEGSRH